MIHASIQPRPRTAGLRRAARRVAAYDPFGAWFTPARRRREPEAHGEHPFLVTVRRVGVPAFTTTILVDAGGKRDAAALAETLAEQQRGGTFESVGVSRAPRAAA